MKILFITVLAGINLLSFTPAARSVAKNQIIKNTNNMKQILIDKFTVPADAEKEFTARVLINRKFIRTLPGFIEDAAYQHRDENNNLICVTVAVWESPDAIKNAREAVQAEYKKEGFNMPAMLEKWGVKFERGIYEKMEYK